MSGLEHLTAPQLLAAWADARDLRRNAVYADHPAVRARDERDGDMAMRAVEKEIERRLAAPTPLAGVERSEWGGGYGPFADTHITGFAAAASPTRPHKGGGRKAGAS